MDWKNGIAKSVLEKWNLESDNVPWRIHPWEVDQEEVNMEQAFVQRFATLWDSSDCFPLPTSSDIQFMTDSTPHLARVGEGIAFFKSDSFRQIRKIASMENGARETREAEPFQMIQSTRLLVPTATTCRNLSLLGAAMCQEPHPPPILICGPHGSGKSSLARELLRLCRPYESLMEFHIDEETDSKTLIGSYTTTDIPGEFAWRAGALTRASREGRWILIEELDGVPVEIQAALVKVFEERMLPLGNGKYERCHPDFRIFATCTTTKPSIAQSVDGEEGASLRIGRHKGGGKQILNPSYWRKVHVKPLPFSELNEVAASVYPSIPRSVVESAMVVLRTLDCSGRSNTGGSGLSEHSVGGSDISRDVVRLTQRWTGGRVPTVRDLFKLLSRIASGICFERDVTFTTEAQRTLCMAESIDIFVGSCAERDVKNDFISLITAPAWGISRDFALKYMNARKPEVVSGSSFYEIGRAKIDVSKSFGFSLESSGVFAQTCHALRFMESLAVCVRENEPALLVGETGCGKTTMIQQLALHCERTLIVQNLSLQTDSTDLLGGYRPLEMQNVARHVYKDFVDIFVSSFSRKQNAKFLQYAASMLEKSNWKKLSQCFQKASQLGSVKMKKLAETDGIERSDPLLIVWTRFARKAETFERQRISCDAGLAFEFAEGALVDAIQCGKW
jgi:midasin